MKINKLSLLILLLINVTPGGNFIITGQITPSASLEKNLAVVATATGQNGNIINFPNDGLIPTNTGRIRRPPNRPAPRLSTQWVQYEWQIPVSTGEISIFWWDYENSVRIPVAYRIKYWNGTEFIPVSNPIGLGRVNNQFNKSTFDVVKTTKLRIEADSAERSLLTILEWKVVQAANSPDYPPVVYAGPDRCAIINGKTYLSGNIRSVTPVTRTSWKKFSGPGNVSFVNENSLSTTAAFSVKGDYVLTLTVEENKLSSASSLNVKVQQSPPEDRLDVVYTKPYKINSPLWNSRAKALMVNWIPWCIDQINRTDLTLGQGGLDNFIEAGKALRGETHKRHLGYVFSNAWVHQTVESMCIALMVDHGGDKEIMAAQEKMKATLEKWIPIILAAQEPDGYLQTAFTLRDTARWKNRWAPETRGNHEGYVSGYFIESAINHYTLTSGKDLRLYDAAKKLADCWVSNIGPGKKEWFDGHQEMEQALVRFGRFVNDMEGNGKGDNYIKLSKFLLDCRKSGSEYDQSHVPVQQQYEAVGHAVRAAYNYSAMADIAAETKDVDYQSAVMSVWDNLVNKKYYITGGIGSGESAEGFGPDFSLPDNAYCESCSSCGLIFFQYKMNLAYNDAKYADLYEETMYNALLGSIDLEGKHFYYDNPLASSQSRYGWHVCPCCVGNIPRTLLMIPTWTYVKSKDGLYVNMFIGSTIKVEKVAGTNIEMIQETDYPWSGKIRITVNPEQPREFSLFIRVPNRSTSNLYKATPLVNSLRSLSVNGMGISPQVLNGYVKINRLWKAGDKVDIILPMEVQTITADERIKSSKGKVALRYGPLIYNVEKADQPEINKNIGSGPFVPVWQKDLLGGIISIKGKWADGSDLTAIPNYSRNNRNTIHGTDKPEEGNRDEGSMVWIKKQ
jgi:DUF1680 family protein